jgi:uncharacterized peroxidase-related enzyme
MNERSALSVGALSNEDNMTLDAISRFPVPDLADLPADLQQLFHDVSEKAGFVPNVFWVLAHRPDELRAFWAYHEALMRRSSGLTKGEREMIVVATSAENNCLYCVVAHGAILRIYEKSAVIADEIATNYKKANITDRQKAMLDFAIKTCNRSQDIGEDDFTMLYQHGFSDDDIWDIAAITGLFALSNRMASLTSMRPNAEFFALGRDFPIAEPNAG